MSILEVSSTFVDRRFLFDSYCYPLSVISYQLIVNRGGLRTTWIGDVCVKWTRAQVWGYA
jgi:hypothetical protein